MFTVQVTTMRNPDNFIRLGGLIAVMPLLFYTTLMMREEYLRLQDLRKKKTILLRDYYVKQLQKYENYVKEVQKHVEFPFDVEGLYEEQNSK